MPLKVRFDSTIICGSFNNSPKLRAVQFFDSYFYLGGRRCEVIKAADNKFEVQYIKSIPQTYTALKVASWFLTLGILPLLMFIGKSISRGLCDFSMENPYIKSEFANNKNIVSSASSKEEARTNLVNVKPSRLLKVENDTVEETLSEQNWTALLAANDLSYIVTILHGLRKKGLPEIKQAKMKVENRELYLKGYTKEWEEARLAFNNSAQQFKVAVPEVRDALRTEMLQRKSALKQAEKLKIQHAKELACAEKELKKEEEKYKQTNDEIAYAELMTKRCEAIVDKLIRMGWHSFTTLLGKTGSGNIDDDAACVVMINTAQNVGFAAFHGSCTGAKFNVFSPHGDWGSNHDKKLKKAVDANLRYVPDYVRVHSGFGDNFASVQDVFLQQIEEKGKWLLENQKTLNLKTKPIWIVTGHSKGGAEAIIALGVTKSFLNEKQLDIDLGAVTISAPRAFDYEGAHWIHDLVHPEDILRLKVDRDPVTNVPPEKNEYSHVGTLVLDRIDAVRKRNNAFQASSLLFKSELLQKAVKGFEKLKISTIDFLEKYINYHYGAWRDGIWSFVPDIVMRHSELREGLKVGREDRILRCKLY
jgi:hypothetical protein